MRKRIVVMGLLLSTGVAAWLGAQALAPTKAPAELMPAGALFYLEARKFSQLVSDWDQTPEKKAWLESANYQAWTRSHLAVRLADIRKKYTDAAGVAETAPLLEGIAGAESAMAFYDIGRLQFLYITQIGSARFADSALGKVKQKFQARKAGGRDYFVLSKGENTIAFALADGRLILATSEELMASSLRLMNGEALARLRDERWFDEALAKAPGDGGVPDIRFVGDLDRTTKTHQFRSYWVQRNGAGIRQFASEVADLKLNAAGGIQERRVFLRREAQDSLAGATLVVDDLMRYAIPEAGFVQAAAKPDPAGVARVLAEKLFGHNAAIADGRNGNRFAPGAPDGADAGGEEEYERRIDLPQAVETAADDFAPLSALANNADGLLQTGGVDGSPVLPEIDSALALHGAADWSAVEVKRVLGQVAGAVWSVSPGSLEWVDRNGVSELTSVAPLRFAIDGRVLVVSASPEWMTRVLAGRQRAVASPRNVSYVAMLRYAKELPGFTRMMGLMDFPSLPQPGQQAAAAGDVREPLFFSENIASLAGALGRLDSVSITAEDTGAMVSETVVYRKK